MVKTFNQEYIENSILSTIKSIAKKEDIACIFEEGEVSFEQINQKTFANNQIKLPKIGSYPQTRAVGDIAALYISLHSPEIHSKFSFDSLEKQDIFDGLEKARLIVVGSKKYLGIRSNVKQYVEGEVDEIFSIRGVDYYFLKEALGFFKDIGEPSLFKNLRQEILELKLEAQSQERFSIVASNIIAKMDRQEKEAESQSNNQKEVAPSQENESFSGGRKKPKNSEEIASQGRKEKPDFQAPRVVLEAGRAAQQGIAEKSVAIGGPAQNCAQVEFVGEYKIFTKQYDQTLKASDLADKGELEKLRKELNLKTKDLSKISQRLRSKLKRKLLSKKIVLKEFNKEEGFVDHRKFSKIIINPAKKDNYFFNKENDYQDTIVTFLIDNSGSMRGNPIVMSAMACETIAQILENFSIKSEIIGFTTSSWHGGKSKKLWQISKSPSNPGRLNDLCHIIYKNFNQPLSKAKNNLALMLKEGLLKENIDAEALLFASKRLIARPENRKILIIISDGAPVDDSTNSNNSENILTSHLHRVINRLEKKSDIELAAIGIGHDVGQYYRNSITIKNLEDLGDSMIEKVCELL